MSQGVMDDERKAVDPYDVAEDVERRRLDLATGSASRDDTDEETDSEDGLSPEDRSGGGSTSGSRSGSGGSTGFYNPNGSGGDKKGGANTSETQASNSKWNALAVGLRSKGGSLLKNKWFIGLSITGSGLIIIIILLLMMLSAYKLPHLTANISAWRFARIMSHSAIQNSRTMSTKVAIDAASDRTYGRFKTAYANGTGKVSEQWSKLDKYRPNKQIKVLNASGMTFNYQARSKLLGGNKLLSISINDKTLHVPQSSFIKNRIPFNKFTNDVKTASLFTPELNKALRANDAGVIVRSIVNTKLRKQLGIGWVAWKAGQYKGKTAEQVRIAEEKANSKAVYTKDPNAPVTDDLKKAVKDGQDAIQETIDNDDSIKQAIVNDGVSSEMAEVVDNVGKTNAFKTTIGVLSPFYTVAVPLCIIYDGSVDNSGSAIDAASDSHMKSWGRVETIADQQKDGLTVDPKVIQAYDKKTGDLTATAVYQRTSGANYTTANYTSPQAGSNGSFTLFDAVFGDNAIINVAESTANGSCAVLSNMYFNIGVGVIGLIGTFFTAGTSTGTVEVVGQAATRTVAKVAEKTAARFSVKQGLKGVGRSITGGAKMRTFLAKEFAKGGATVGLTMLAKAYVANKSGMVNSGLEQGADYVGQLDSGADLTANEYSRQQQMGRPLTASEVNESNDQARTYLAQQNSQKSAFERYLAISNPDSLLTNVATVMASNVNRAGISARFNPSNIGSSLVGLFSPTVKAAETAGEANYYNVQWGWSKEEIGKLTKDPSYEMLENQSILDTSGQEDAITEKYAKCFGIDGSGDERGTTIGSLLAGGDIKRDENGNVLSDDSDCSPSELSYTNAKYGPEMVFRWRVARADNNDLDEKLYEQVVTESQSATTTGGAEFTIASLNIFHSDDQPESVWGARLDRSMKTLTDNQVDIAGLQEVRGNQNAAISSGMHGSSTYDIYPSAASSANQNFSPNPIIWNKEKYTKVSTSAMPFLYFDRQSDTAPVVKLQDNGTGQQFYVINIHHPADTHGEASAIRYEDAVKNAAFIKDLGKEGLPIFFTGDFNNRYTTVDASKFGNNPPGNDCNKLTYVVMSNQSDLWDAYDAANGNTTVRCPTSAPANGNVVDHIFLSKSLTQVTYKNLGDSGKGNNGSDTHNTILAHVVIPGAATTTTGAGTSFRISSYNVKVGAPEAWRVTAAKVMKQNNFDVVGMQELEHADDYRSMKAQLDDTYDLYPTVAGTERNNIAARTIAYKRDKFEFVKADEVTFVRMGGQDHQPAHAPVVWLKDKQTGQVIIVINTHNPAYGPHANPPSGTGAYNGNQQRYEAGLKYAAKVKELSSEGLPIFFTGDFNEADGLNDQMTYQGRVQNLNYCQLVATGIMKDTEHAFLNKPDGNYCTANSSARGGAIDRIYVSKSVQVKKFARLSGNSSTLGTDHSHVPYADVVVPSSGTTGGQSGPGSPNSDTSLKTVNNFRDAGNATGVIRKGVLYRSGTISTISDKEATTLSKLLLGKNGTIIDLQSTRDLKYVSDKNIPAVAQSAPLGIPATFDYTNFVDETVDRQGFNKALTQIANANGPVLVHCRGGNDRTGWTVAMIMYVLDASDEQVLKEYTTSPGVHDKKAWLYNGLDDVQRKFGTAGKKNYHDAVMKYLTTDINRGGLGLSQQTLTNLRQGLSPQS